MNWLIRKYRIWKIKRNTMQGMKDMSYLKHISRVFFISSTIGFIDSTLHSFPELTKRILIIVALAAVSGVFIVQTINYLRASFKKEVLYK
jgi:hypothetical protein